MKFHAGQVSRLFYEFENKYFDQLKHINVCNWNAWRIVKSPLYLDSVYLNVKDPGKESGKKIKLFWFVIKSISIIYQIFVFCFRLKKNCTVIITHTANKTMKDSSNLSYDQIVDGLIIKSGIKNYLYIEIPGLPKESSVKPKIEAHFKEQDFKFIKIALNKLLVSKSEVKLSAERLASLFNGELKNLGLTTSGERLEKFIAGFCVDYFFYKWLFKLLKPKFLITNDLMGSGMIAAAQSLRIQSLELQHGIMDEYYPQYQMPPKFVSIKRQLPIADKVGVFGQFHKDQLVSKGFWKNDEVIVVGKFELSQGDNSIPRFSDKPTLLFAAQGILYFNQSIIFLESLLTNSFRDFYLVIKLHPLEPEYCKVAYQKLEKVHSRVTVVQSQFNLTELFSVSDFVISYNSTVLIEAVAKGIISFTICDDILKNGIYDLIGESSDLEKFLLKVSKAGELINFLQKKNKIGQSKEFKSVSRYLYENPYAEKLIGIIN